MKRHYSLARTLAGLLIVSLLSVGAVQLMDHHRAEGAGRTFTVGFDAEFPPYGYKDEDGNYVGYDLDLAQEVCDRNGWTLVKQPIDWDSKDMELKTGAIDCIWNGFTMNGREDDYTFTVPYIDNSQVVIVRKDSDIKSLEDLAGKTVVVQSDSSALAAFTGDDATDENRKLAESFRELQQVADYNSAFMNLESGMVDAVCMDFGVAKYQVESRKDEFRLLDTPVSSEQYGVGFLKGNTELRDQVQKTLAQMVYDGTYDKINEKWDLSDSACLKDYLNKDGTAKDAGKDSEDTATEVGESQIEDITPGSKAQDKLGVRGVAQQLVKGMASTVAIFFLTLIFSLPLGLLVTFVRMSRFRVLSWIARIYISIMRGTPLMLQLLVVFFGPYYIFGMQTTSHSFRFVAVIIGFVLNYAAYFAEIFRSGIQGVPVGQREAAKVLGYSKTQTFCRIVFPQMVKAVMPPVTNEVITLVKDTSLAFALSYAEMFTIAKQLVSSQASVMPLFVAGVFYYVFNFLIAFIMDFVEKKLNYYR